MEKPAQTEHPIEEVLRRRWSPRAFSDRTVEVEKLQSLFEAARWAASCFNEQPWHFIVAFKESQQEFAALRQCLTEKNQQWAGLAPVLMVSVAQLNFEKTAKPNRHAWHDVGLAMGNMSAQATALGLFIHQMAGIIPEKVRALYHIPDGFDPVAAIAVGYPASAEVLPEQFREQELRPRMRKSIDSFVFQGEWGKVARFQNRLTSDASSLQR